MAKPYSEDLRRRVVEAIDGGATIPDAAEQCGVSISSVVRFLKLHRDTGSVSAAKFGGYKEFVLAAHEEVVRNLIAETAGHYTGGSKNPSGKEESFGRQVGNLPILDSFEVAL